MRVHHVVHEAVLLYHKLIIQSGIKRVVYAEKYRLDDGIKLMQRAGIKVEYLNPEEKTSSVED